MRVLVACEFSGVVRDAFIRAGHDAWSCDLLPSESDKGSHYRGDVIDILYDDWDLLIAHPPCQYLCNSGVRWLFPGGTANWERWDQMETAAQFFRSLLDAPIERICIENSIMHRYAVEIIGRRQDQVVQPWWFGHKEMKATCLWLKNLRKLKMNSNVGPPPKDKAERRKWARVHRESPGPDRWKNRSRTLSGLADAMVDQWGDL